MELTEMHKRSYWKATVQGKRAGALHCHPDYICSSNHPLTPGSKATYRSCLGHPDGLYLGSEWELGPAPEQQLPPLTRPWVGHEVLWKLRGRQKGLCEAFRTSWAGIVPRWDSTGLWKSKATAFISLLEGADPVAHRLLHSSKVSRQVPRALATISSPHFS